MERLHTASRNDEPFSNNSCLQPMVGDVRSKALRMILYKIPLERVEVDISVSRWTITPTEWT